MNDLKRFLNIYYSLNYKKYEFDPTHVFKYLCPSSFINLVFRHFKSESRRRKKLYENKRKSVSKRFLRQHANELKRQRDFNNFLTQHDIGTINEIDSISSSESSIFHSKMNSSMIKKDRYQVYPFNNMKEFDMNKAFQLQNPKQLEKRNTSKYFLSSLRSELNVKWNKNQIFKSWDFSQEFCSDKPDYSYTPCNASSIKSEILRISGIVNQNSRNISVINLSIQERKLFKMFKSS